MKVNDKVRLSKHGTECYGNTNHNPHDKEGIIIAIRTQKTGTHPITVKWENEKNNQYRNEDLVVVSETPVISNNYEIY